MPSHELLLRASLAAALLGEAYEGQREFVATTISGSSPEALKMFPVDNSPKSIAELSAYAIARDFAGKGFDEAGLPYTQIAMSFDPGNPCIALLMGDSLAVKDSGSYTLAIKALESGLPRSGTGEVHLQLEYELQLVKENLRTIGDHNNLVPPRAKATPKTPTAIHP